MARRNERWIPYCDVMYDSGLRQYQVAAEAHISPFTLSRWLRENPTETRLEIVGDAINSLLAQRPVQVEFKKG